MWFNIYTKKVVKRITLQTTQTCTKAFWAAFFWSLAVWPCCFFILACFSAALAWDWIFCCPRAISEEKQEKRVGYCNYVCEVKSSRQLNTNKWWEFLTIFLTFFCLSEIIMEFYVFFTKFFKEFLFGLLNFTCKLIGWSFSGKVK